MTAGTACLRLPALGVALAVVATPALAHHAMDGQMPRTLAQGLLSGLAHPVIGLDHLAFIVGIGIVGAVAGLGLMPPLIFIAAASAGISLHLAGVDLPAVELLVAVSVIGLGLAIFAGRTGRLLRWASVLLALGGVFHGYAFAESIIGAEPTPLLAYLSGLVLVQFAVTAAAYVATRALLTRRHALRIGAPRLAGAVIAAVGLVFAAGAGGLVG